jgi:hypothetical protein
MRFHELAVGAGFQYRGRPYVKTGPLTARGPEGGDRIIPRSALVQPSAPPAPAPHPSPDEAAVRTALGALERDCLARLDSLGAGAGPKDLAAARAGLERAFAEFRARLGLGP